MRVFDRNTLKDLRTLLRVDTRQLANTRKVNGFHVFLLVSVLLMLVILVGVP